MKQDEAERVDVTAFLEGHSQARRDWEAGQPYASYVPTRSDSYKDGYAFFLRWTKYQPGEPTCH